MPKEEGELEKKTTSTTMLTLLLISMYSLALNIHSVAAETITVPGDYPTIQSAINAANSSDTILVAAGTYLENVIVNKTVTLIGENSNTTIIDGSGNGTVVLVTANNVSLSRFTVKNSSGAWPYSGIYIGARNANISDNIITNNWYGIWLWGNSSSSFLSNNNVTNNQYGVKLDHISNNVLLGNRIASNQYNLVVWGSTLSHFIHNIDNSNRVDNKPVYYWVNQHNAEIPSDAGYVSLVNSTEITVKDLNLTSNGVGIQLAYTQNSSIANINLTNSVYGFDVFYSSNNVLSNNTVKNNRYGIALSNSSDNFLLGNNVTNNQYGIRLLYSSNNTIYRNTFVNTNQSSVAASENIWDNGYPSGGNYWSDYTGVDLKNGPNQDQPGSDGIGDTPYIMDIDNIDRYPLMDTMEVHDVAITNTTISKTVVGQGYELYINVHVANKGNRIETFNITVYVNSTLIGTQTFNNMTVGELSTITFTWNTTGFAKANYTISAYAWPVLYETNTADNNSTYGGVKVAVPGDINSDGKISITDIVTIASAYGSRLGELLFKPNADIDSDQDIDIYDITIAASRYGYEEP